MKRLTSLLIAVILTSALFNTCQNPASNNECKETISTCSGDPCGFYKVYDEAGNFIAEGYTSTVVRWSGIDCTGKKVKCGLYTVTLTLWSAGSSRSFNTEVLVADSNSVSASGHAACDSLKKYCSGEYKEIYSDDYVCLCCK
jgi:hypothetical protein